LQRFYPDKKGGVASLFIGFFCGNLLQARLGGIFTVCPAKLHLSTPAATAAAANTARKGK